MSEEIIPIEDLRVQNERLKLELDNKQLNQKIADFGWEDRVKSVPRRTLKQLQSLMEKTGTVPGYMQMWKSRKVNK